MKGRDNMGYDGKLTFDTKIDESGFNSGIKRLGTIAAGGLKILAGAVTSVSAAIGTGVVIGAKYNASIEQYQTSFEVMTGSAEKAVEVVERLKEVGAATPFELNNLADTTQLLMNYGFTADDAMDKMMMLGDIAQGSAEKMQRIATAYGQMSSAGKVSLEDVKQMIEAGFNPLQEISQTTGESMTSLYDRISKGTIAVDEITASMQRATSEGGKYFQSMEKQSQTINGLISTLKDNAMQLLGDVVQPITESFKTDLLPAAIETVDELAVAFKNSGADGLIEAGGKILADLVSGIAQKAPTVIETAVKIIDSFIASLGNNMPLLLESGVSIAKSLVEGLLQIGKTIYSVGGQLLYDFITGLSERFPEIVSKALEMVVTLSDSIISNLPTIINAGISLLKGLLMGIIQSLPLLISEGPRIINDFADAIYSGLWELLKAGGELLLALIKGIWENVPLLLENAGEIFMMFINIFSLSNMFNLGKNLINNLVSGIKNLGPNMVKTGGNIVEFLVNGIKNFATHPVTTLKNIASNAMNAIKSLNWKSIGSNIISGIVNGLKNGINSIIKAAKDVAGAALSAAKKVLGIKSPSRRFRDEVGKMMAVGMGEGFEKNMPVDEMTGTLNDSVQKMQKRVSSVTQNAGSDTAGNVNKMIITGGQGNKEPDNVNVVIENHFEVDGTPLVDKTTKATIKKINSTKKDSDKMKGK